MRLIPRSEIKPPHWLGESEPDCGNSLNFGL